MPMSRTGLSSLMGYAPGGAVDLADIPDANVVNETPVTSQPTR